MHDPDGPHSDAPSSNRPTSEPAPRTPPLLVNATATTIWVNTPIGPVPLSEHLKPSIHDVIEHGDEHPQLFRVATPRGDYDVPVTVGPGTPHLTVAVPDQVPGVVYLVDRDILMRLPQRSDLLTPATFTVRVRDEPPAPPAHVAPAQSDPAQSDRPEAAPPADESKQPPGARRGQGPPADADVGGRDGTSGKVTTPGFELQPFRHTAHTALTVVPAGVDALRVEDLGEAQDSQEDVRPVDDVAQPVSEVGPTEVSFPEPIVPSPAAEEETEFPDGLPLGRALRRHTVAVAVRRRAHGGGHRTWPVVGRSTCCSGTPLGHTYWVHALAVTPHGRVAVSGDFDRVIRVWDLATGQQLGTLTGDVGPIRAVAVAPDGRTLVSCSDDRTVRVWDLATGALLRTLRGHNGVVTAVAISPVRRFRAT